MSKRHKGHNNNANPPEGGRPITKPPRDISLKVPQPLAIVQQSTPEDNARYAEESKNRADQLTTAQNQLDTARLLNRINIAGAVVGILGLFFVYGSFRTSRVAANAAKSAADTAKDTLIVQNRPWLKVTHTIDTPLTFDVADPISHHLTAEIGFGTTLENVGQSPALILMYRAELIPYQANTWPSKIALEWQTLNCDPDRQRFGASHGIVFPHDHIPYEPVASHIPMELINSVAALPSLVGGSGRVEFIFVGCITYRFSFEKSDAVPHQTRFSDALTGKTKNISIDPKVPVPELTLAYFPVGNAAD